MLYLISSTQNIMTKKDPRQALLEAEETAENLRVRIKLMEEQMDEDYVHKVERAQLSDAMTGNSSVCRDQVLASRALTDPATSAALAMKNMAGNSICSVPLDIGEIAVQIRAQIAEIREGDLDAVKEITAGIMFLSDQAAKQALSQAVGAPTPEATAVLGSYGMKAATITLRAASTLNGLNQPTPVYVAQQNVGHNQLIQNGRDPVEVAITPVQTDNSESENQLLERKYATRSDFSGLDTRKAEKAVGSNTEMETLGKVDRAEK